ncbi:MAG: Rrf2 family transcriptional regulator [Pirellulaceae bacterium]|nr:Rrf2 family transcriptional regulator [Pirellulaceae bacterium]
MSLLARSHYAAVAMLELAIRLDAQQPVSLRGIAEMHQVPLPFLTQILQQLKVAGLVVSSRGASGGYRLQRPASTITLAEIIDAVSPRSLLQTKSVQTPVNRVLEQVWEEIEESNQERLRGIRLDQLAHEATQTNEVMFYI